MQLIVIGYCVRGGQEMSVYCIPQGSFPSDVVVVVSQLVYFIRAIATQTCGFNLMSLREIVTADRETTTNYGLSGQMVE